MATKKKKKAAKPSPFRCVRCPGLLKAVDEIKSQLISERLMFSETLQKVRAQRDEARADLAKATPRAIVQLLRDMQKQLSLELEKTINAISTFDQT